MGGAELFLQEGKRIRYRTFRKVCKEYLSRRNKKDYQGQMQRIDYWCKVFGDGIMTDIDIFDIREHVEGMIDDGERNGEHMDKKAIIEIVEYEVLW